MKLNSPSDFTTFSGKFARNYFQRIAYCTLDTTTFFMIRKIKVRM